MRYVAQMLLEAFRYLQHDPSLGPLVVTTLRLGLEATAVALVLGLPLACAIGLGRARLSRWGFVIANAGLGLPPTAVGVYLALLISGTATAPWGGRWYGTLNGMVLAQTLLALPIIVAITAAAIRGLPDGVIEQARAFGARRWRLGLFALREAKVGVVAAIILALCSAFGEVGAIGLFSGLSDSTTTLALQTIEDQSGMSLTGRAVEHTLVLLAMMVALGLILLTVQGSSGRPRRRVRWLRPWSRAKAEA